MKDVAGKVAFITGGANGIGLGLAKAFCDAGIKVAIADIRRDDLDRACDEVAAKNRTVYPIVLDVMDRKAMAQAADEAEKALGNVHILCNNAGINFFGPLDEATYDDWDWVMGVNLNGVINGLQTFISRIKRHGEGGHIVNTASMAAFLASPRAGIYTGAKFAVLGLTEALWYRLAPMGIGVSVLCPGLVRSNIHASEEIRPRTLADSGYQPGEDFFRQLGEIHSAGMDPVEVGEKVLHAIRRNQLYIFTHPEFREELKQKFDEILAALPEGKADPRRLAFEEGRRRQLEAIKANVRKMGEAD